MPIKDNEVTECVPQETLKQPLVVYGNVEIAIAAEPSYVDTVPEFELHLHHIIPLVISLNFLVHIS